jgi:hypothetical protein
MARMKTRQRAMFGGHRRRNDPVSSQIGQLYAGFGQAR